MTRWERALAELPIREPDEAAGETAFNCLAFQLTHLTSKRSKWRVIALTRPYDEIDLGRSGGDTFIVAVAKRRDTPA